MVHFFKDFFDEYKLKNSIYLLLNVFVLISFDQFITSLLNKSVIIYLYIISFLNH